MDVATRLLRWKKNKTVLFLCFLSNAIASHSIPEECSHSIGPWSLQTQQLHLEITGASDWNPVWPKPKHGTCYRTLSLPLRLQRSRHSYARMERDHGSQRGTGPLLLTHDSLKILQFTQMSSKQHWTRCRFTCGSDSGFCRLVSVWDGYTYL